MTCSLGGCIFSHSILYSMAPPLQYSCLENPMDGGAWWAAVHGIAKSRIWLSNFTFTFHVHALEKEMATHSSVLAWRIPGTGEPGGPLFMGSHRVGHDWSDLAAAAAYSTQRLIYWWQVPFTLGGISAINRHFLSLAKWEILSALSYFIFNFFGVQRHYHELPLINTILSWG